ncbi:MAG: sulfite exporter TauE/SafE family protein [Spirochaetia bacterium]|nr:sulfite exporter TauE/SafE family protein [Spirochaetia bacterium]
MEAIPWYTYWYLFPIAFVIAIVANSSGFSGGVLFQPIYYLFIHIALPGSVATGVATETVGMTSGSIRYFMQGKVEKEIGLVLVMLTIPGAILGSHILVVLNANILRMLLGVVIIVIASIQFLSVAQGKFGSRVDVPVEDIYPFMWVPLLGGFFSATTGTGICETAQPLLERGLNIKTLRANATAIWAEAMGDWVITILNLQAGLIIWQIMIFTGTGVIIGGQIGPVVAKYMPEKFLKIFFSIAVTIIGIFYIFTSTKWLLSVLHF